MRAAAYFRVALRLGVCTVQEVLAWADCQIESQDEPQYELIELSMLGNLKSPDVLRKLEDLSREIPSIEILPSVLGSAHKRLLEHREFGQVLAHGLYELYVQENYEVPDCLSPIARFDDGYSLALGGTYGTEEDIYNDLLEFTGNFVSFSNQKIEADD